MAGPARTRYRYDVFLSHSSADKPVVRELAEGLRTAGLRVWLDEWILQPGDLISAKIEEGLEHSAVLLLCMSANAFGSDWVSLEHHTAIFRDPQNLERRFVPLLLDDAPIKAMLRGYAYIDWRPGVDREAGWGRLLGACGVEGGNPERSKENCTRLAPLTTDNLSRDDSCLHSNKLLLAGHKGSVSSVCLSGDSRWVVSGGVDSTLRLWEVPSGRQLSVLEGHIGPVWSVGWSGDGERVVSGGADGTVRLWEVNSGSELTVLEGHRGHVLSVCWSGDSEHVVSGGADGTVRLWDVKSGRQLSLLEGHRGQVLSVCWSADGKHVASGGDDGSVRLWEAESYHQLAVLIGHNGTVRSVGWSGDGQCLVTSGVDGTVRLWNAKNGRSFAVLEGHQGWVWSVTWRGDEQCVASGGYDGSIRLWDVKSSLELVVLEGHKGPVHCVSRSDDGKYMVSGGYDGTVRLWDVISRCELVVLEGHKGAVHSVVRSGNGRYAVSGGYDGTVRLWDVRSGHKLVVLEGHMGQVFCCACSIDGNLVVSGGEDGTVRLWEVKSGRELVVLAGHKGSVLSVCWSADSRMVVSAGEDETVRLWDVQTAREMVALEGHNGWVNSVSLNVKRELIVSGGVERTVRLWDVKSGRELAVLEGHKYPVLSVCWSEDGGMILSGGYDGVVRMWDAQSGQELASMEGHQALVLSVGWAGGGTGFWTADHFGVVLFWDQDPLHSDQLARNELFLTYTNAKVLVVGDSGAGKTGLTQRLATGGFQPSESTVGVWCTQWSLPQPVVGDGEPQREVWLWDFGGQADQRLIHQLFLDRAALVLLLFDASRDEVLEGLHDWQTALRRTLATPPPQLLVAARVDAGFRASRARLEGFAAEQGMAFLETSARDGSGCEALQRAIHNAIAWDQLPRHTSPRLFQEIKREILRLRDQGEVLLTYKDLRERLRQRVLTPGLDDPALQTVLGLLDGPGVLKKLDYGDYVLLKPEWLGVYGQAVLRRLRQEEPQLGALPVGAIAAAALPFADGQPRLEAAEEQVLLAELERQLQERKICLRQRGQLVFPSHCGRERPPSPSLPPPFVSYAVCGWLDDIHATLVVSLAETRVFHLQDLWRDAAEFRTLATPRAASGRALAVQLQRHNVSEGTITLHVASEVPDAERVQFAQFIDGHLRDAAETVERRRHWLCPHCHAPKGNGAVLMQKLARDGERAQVVCDGCDRPFPLYDNLERLFADTSIRREAEALGQQDLPELTARRNVLIQEVGARLTSANQKWQEINPDEDDGIDLQVEFTDDDGNGTGRYLFLQLKAGPSHLRRRRDGREMFAIKKPRWIRTWTQQPGPVMLVIGRPATPDRERDWLEGGRPERRAFPDVRWMEISSVLKRELDAGRSPEQITQIEFTGEPLDLASVLRWRRRILDAQSPTI